MSANEKQKFLSVKTTPQPPPTSNEVKLNNLNNNNNNCSINHNNNINMYNESKDVVDFAPVRGAISNSNSNSNLLNQGKANGVNCDVSKLTKNNTTTTTTSVTNQTKSFQNNSNQKAKSFNESEVKCSIKTSLSTLEKLPIFMINAKKKYIEATMPENAATLNAQTGGGKMSSPVLGLLKDKPRFVKSASIARLLGNTYNTKKFENELQLLNASLCGATDSNSNSDKNGGTGGGGRPFPGAERFHKCQEFENDVISVSNGNQTKQNAANSTGSSGQQVHASDFTDDKDMSASRAFRTISRSLGKLLRRRTHSIEISTPDPEYKVSYLGNVLTGWAKGDGCVEKPLNTLWRNHTQNHKPDVIMRIRVCASGLKATTRQHGLTEYWAHRITHCCAPKNYPRVFCWIYRHEGRKMKHEMRCHAVLCTKESIAQQICTTLRDNLDRALRDFKREKLSKQNARLSLANAAYENPSLPRRKILLSVGGNNYRPPLERSKSAPKLMAIEEAIGEEDEDTEQTNQPEMPSCCQKDSLYPAFTLGRRKCRRGHSIRRTGKVPTTAGSTNNETEATSVGTKESSNQDTDNHTCNTTNNSDNASSNSNELSKDRNANESRIKSQSVSSLASDDDDLDKVLISHDYDTSSPLADELLSYLDKKLKSKPDGAQSLNNLDDTSILYDPKINSDSMRRPALSLDNLDSLSDCDDEDGVEHYVFDDADEVFYQQSAILKLYHRNSLNKMAEFNLDADNERIDESKRSVNSEAVHSSILNRNQPQQIFDSDEGSISSGCETASTVTANMDDTSLKYIQSQQQTMHSDSSPVQQQLQNDGTVISSTTIRLSQKKPATNSESDVTKVSSASMHFKLPPLRHISSDMNRPAEGGDVSDSEFSDESGYVEFQEQHQVPRGKGVVV